MSELSVPKIDFSSLAELPKVYRDARNEQSLANLGRDIEAGTVDYQKAAGIAIQAGNPALGLQFLGISDAQKKQALEREAAAKFSNDISKMYGGGGVTSAPTRAAPAAVSQTQILPEDQFNSIDAMADLKPGTQAKLPAAQGAVSGIESGGRYDATGPAIASGPMAGQRGIGKYQVMEGNVGPWTKEVLGRAMTAQEFAANPDAQDAVFNAKFGGYMDKYGAGGAARAWHAGEGGMNNPAAGDQLGTSTVAYGDRVASAVDGGALPPNARLAGPAQQPPSTPQASQAQPQRGPQAVQLEPQPNPRAAAAAVPFNPSRPELSQRAVQLMQAVSNPSLPAPQREVAKQLLNRELDNSKVPDLVKQYLFAKSEGYAGNLADFKKSSAVHVNVGGNSTEFDKEFDKKTADRFGKYLDNADAARKKMVDIDTMRDIHERLGTQGAAAGIKEAIGPYADMFDIKIDGLSDVQAYSQVIQRLAPQQRAPGSGSTSDVEFKGFVKSLPGLSQNPAAREIGLNTMEALARDEIARGDIASELSTKEITRVEAERKLRALPDPMKAFKEWRKANPTVYGEALRLGRAGGSAPTQGSAAASASPPRVSSPADLKGLKLKSGDTFMDDAGNLRRVP